MQNAKCRIQNVESKTQNAKTRIHTLIHQERRRSDDAIRWFSSLSRDLTRACLPAWVFVSTVRELWRRSTSTTGSVALSSTSVALQNPHGGDSQLFHNRSRDLNSYSEIIIKIKNQVMLFLYSFDDFSNPDDGCKMWVVSREFYRRVRLA